MIAILPAHARMLRVAAPWLLGWQVLATLASPPPVIPKPDADSVPTARVVAVNDDCSLIVRTSKVRRQVAFAGIRVPRDSRRRTDLRRFLTQLLAGETVWLQALPGHDPKPAAVSAAVRSTEPPHVAQAWVFRAPDGLFVNLEVVRQGAARADLPSDSAYRELFKHYEERARRNHRGLWAGRSAAKSGARHSTAGQTPRTEAGTVTVYVTKSGKKYHRQGCIYLRRSSRPISLQEAIRKGYTPCSRCKPPVPRQPTRKKGG